MINSFKKQIRYWKAASLGLPIVALFSLVIADLLDRGIYEHMINCVLITFACVSVLFWTWTVWQMISLSNYLTNVESNYDKIAKDIAETKELLRGDRENVGTMQRRKSSTSKRKKS